MWILEKIVISKAGNSGEASIFLNNEEETMQLILNKFIINLNNGAEPVAIMRVNGTPVVDGAFSILLKDTVLQIFQESLKDKEIGMYIIDANGVSKVGE